MKKIKYEKGLWDSGVNLVAGVDEAGRGPLAGPLVAAAVVFDKDWVSKLLEETRRNNDVPSHWFWDINDSKKISEKKRTKLYEKISSTCLSYSVVAVDVKEIDKWGIGVANKVAMYKAVKKLKAAPEHVITDHFALEKWDMSTQTNITKGDQKSVSVAAASIIAKVTRDRLMFKIHEKFPVYGFDKHKGYGTKLHKEALKKFGRCEIHRKTFSY